MAPTGDTGLGDAVRERCEPEFLPKLSKAQKRAYDREIRGAATRNTPGRAARMYRSFTAFCQAQSTVAHAAKFGATAKAKQ